MVLVFLCGAAVTTAGVLIATTRYADRPGSGPFTSVGVAVVAGAIWPVLVVGALQAIAISLLAWFIRSGAVAAAIGTSCWRRDHSVSLSHANAASSPVVIGPRGLSRQQRA